jgi:hypothetical protein
MTKGNSFLSPGPMPRAVFTEGSTMRHVIVMTSAASVGLMAIFLVDLLSLLYISWLGDPKLTAAVGFATQVLFFFDLDQHRLFNRDRRPCVAGARQGR